MLNILMVPMESNGSSITELDAVGAEVTNQALNNLENVEVSVEVDTAENDSWFTWRNVIKYTTTAVIIGVGIYTLIRGYNLSVEGISVDSSDSYTEMGKLAVEDALSYSEELSVDSYSEESSEMGKFIVENYMLSGEELVSSSLSYTFSEESSETGKFIVENYMLSGEELVSSSSEDLGIDTFYELMMMAQYESIDISKSAYEAIIVDQFDRVETLLVDFNDAMIQHHDTTMYLDMYSSQGLAQYTETISSMEAKLGEEIGFVRHLTDYVTLPNGLAERAQKLMDEFLESLFRKSLLDSCYKDDFADFQKVVPGGSSK